MNVKFTSYLVKGWSLITGSSITAICLFALVLISGNKAQAQTSEPYNWDNVDIGGGGFVSGIITSKKDPSLMYARTDVGGAYRYDRATSRWIPLVDWASDQQLGILGVESLATDPSDAKNLYLSAGTSYFNSGRSFILRSSDFGATFSVVDITSKFKCHGNGMGRQNGEKLQVDPNKNSILFCGTRRNGLWKSTDFGVSWNPAGNIPSSITTTANDNGISFVVFDKSSAAAGTATSTLFVGISRPGSNSNFYKSTDGGATFTAVDNAALPDNFMPQRAVTSGNGSLYITYGNGAGPYGTTAEPMDQGQIWKYNISTGAWTNITPLSSTNRFNRAFGGISVDPANPNRMVASTINTYMAQGTAWGDRFFLTTDGGVNWTDIIASRGFSMDPNGITWVSTSSIHWAGSIEFDPSNTNRVFVTSGNGIFANEAINTSNVWKFNVNGLEETVPLNLVSIPGGPVISVIGDYDGFRHTDVNQYAPIHTPRIGSTSGLDYGVTNKNKVVRVGGSNMYYSNDMGVTWTKTATINGSAGQVAVSADGATILHGPGSSSTTYRTTNNGSSWTTVSGLTFSDVRPVADGLTATKFYAYNPSSGSFMVSTNGGTSFSAAASPGTGGSKIIRNVPGRDGDIWVALYGGGLKYTENSGSSFVNVGNVTYCGSVGIGKTASGSSYETIFIYGTVNGVLGVHRSTDKGLSWVRVNDDAHEYGGPANGQFVVGDMNVYGRVYMSTAGRGIVFGTPKTTTTCTPTAITPFTQVNGGAWTQTATASLAAGGTVKFGPQPLTGGSWSWTGPNGFTAATREVTVTNVQATNAGTYTANYTNSSGCTSSLQFTVTLSGGVTIRVVSGSGAIADEDMATLTTYPNPVTNAVRVTVSKAFVGGTIAITNTGGAIVFGGRIIQSNNSIEMGNLPSGLYTITIKNNGKTQSAKLIKK